MSEIETNSVIETSLMANIFNRVQAARPKVNAVASVPVLALIGQESVSCKLATLVATSKGRALGTPREVKINTVSFELAERQTASITGSVRLHHLSISFSHGDNLICRLKAYITSNSGEEEIRYNVVVDGCKFIASDNERFGLNQSMFNFVAPQGATENLLGAVTAFITQLLSLDTESIDTTELSDADRSAVTLACAVQAFVSNRRENSRSSANNTGTGAITSQSILDTMFQS